jgi:hypothetical protein
LAQLFFRNSKFSSATIQGDNNLRKYPHNRLVNIYQSEKMAGGRLFYDATFQILGPGNESTLPTEFVVGEGFAVNIVAGFWVPMHIISSQCRAPTTSHAFFRWKGYTCPPQNGQSTSER